MTRLRCALTFILAILLWPASSLAAGFGTDNCTYTGGYPWQMKSCLMSADLNAALAAAYAPPTTLAAGVAATNLGNAGGEVSGPWSNLQVARPLPRDAIPTPTFLARGGVRAVVNTPHSFVTNLDLFGVFHTAQPVLGDIGDLLPAAATFLSTPTSANLRGLVSDETGGGLLYFQGGSLGTPSAGVLTNATDLPVSTGVSGLGTGTAAALAANVGSAGAVIVNGGALGTPSSGTLTNATGLPVGTGISGMAAGAATFLATSTSANLRALLTDEVGTGPAYFQGGALGTPASGTLTNATGLPISTGLSGAGTGIQTALGVNVGSAGAPVINGGALGTPSSGTGTNITGIPNNNVNAVTLASGTSATLTAPRQYYICTGTCTVTPPAPAAGYEFCVRNGNNIATVVTLAALGSSAMYENQAGTGYGTAGTGTLVSAGAVGDKVCIIGLDSTHYLIGSIYGVWTAS